MKKVLFSLIAAAAFIAAVGFFTQKYQGVRFQPPKNNLPTLKEIKIKDVRVSVEVADNEASRRKGLGERDSLGENEGMLFVFDKDSSPVFWMKDTLIPLDIIWIDELKVVGIDKNVPPEPGKADSFLTRYYPPVPVDYVLEVNSGFSDKHGIGVGDGVDLTGI